MRLLGIDFGEKRIGLAISDSEARIATPLTVVGRDSDRQAIEEIRRIARQEEIGALVIGDPRRVDGTRGEASERVESFARKLGAGCGLPVSLTDEVLTSHEAAARLPPGSRRHFDAVAAQILLQQAIDDPTAVRPLEPRRSAPRHS